MAFYFVMSSFTFDPSAYHRAPVLTVGTAITLIDALALVHPRSSPALAKKSLRRLQELRGRIASSLASRLNDPSPEVSVQEIDRVADRAWRAVRGYIAAYLDLAPAFAPHQDAAEKLDAMLFGTGGLAFTQLMPAEQSTQMHNRLDALSAGGHVETLTSIVGDACMKNLRAAVKAYDAMLLSMLKNVDEGDENLVALVREVQKAVVDYARYIAATVDDEEPETVTEALKALAPIDNIRRMAASPSSSVSKDEPAPPTPPAPPSPPTH